MFYLISLKFTVYYSVIKNHWQHMNEIKKENKKKVELKQIKNKIKGRKIWMSKNEERKRNRGQTDIKRRENVKWTEKKIQDCLKKKNDPWKYKINTDKRGIMKTRNASGNLKIVELSISRPNDACRTGQ